jgi:4-amino-4-deoxy-L-arabinose transferase-like glycosyltransferase
MKARGPLAIVCFVAALHGLFFIWYQRPDWYTRWPDQDGYRRLGEVLATTGKFTRFPDAPRFVPEVLRTPVYPLFVAATYRLFGTGQLPIALVQTGVIVLICLLTYGIARRVGSEPVALTAAAAVALFPPIAYFGALVMTEVWTTFLFTLSMWLAIRCIRTASVGRFAALGFALALTTLSRPVFVLFPFALAAIGVVMLPPISRQSPRVKNWGTMLAVFALTMLPWFTYNFATIGRFTLSPAGGVGRGLWEGSWQATWSGRLQNELTHLADDIDDPAELDRRVEAAADREHLPPAPMLEYVHQWQTIRRIWVEPSDPYERALARVRADQEYFRVGVANLRRDTAVHHLKRLARGIFVLWAGEIPFRYSEINDLPPAVIYLCWTVQALVFIVALWGLFALVKAGRDAEALILAAPIVYITVVHAPLLTEARQSLPGQPVLLVLAAAGAWSLLGHSLARETQIHERQHL